MTFSRLFDFISLLESSGDLARITAPVDPALEIAAITNQVCKQPSGGSALLFEKPAGSHFRVATNLFGSTQRVCKALGIATLDELTVRMQALLSRIPDADVTLLDRQIAALPEFRQFAPHAEAEPETALIPMDPPDLSTFPFLQNWPGDGAADGHSRYITLPLVFTTAPDGTTPNCGVYRVQLRGKAEAAIQWKEGSGAARHAELFLRARKRMPVAIILGGDPAALFSAMFPLPGELDEMTFAGFLRGAPLVTVPCRSVPLQVPTGAEVIIEGFIEPGEVVTEGPFGNHTGFYSPAAPASLMKVTSIRHRPDAIIPATVVGPPPMEDCWMAEAWERLLLAVLHNIVPAIKDISFPSELVFHQSAIISLENPQPGMVRNISSQLWGSPWFKAARLLLFINAETETKRLSHALWRTINVTDFAEDVFHDTSSGRVAVDATGCRLSHPKVTVSDEYTVLIKKRWKEYGLA